MTKPEELLAVLDMKPGEQQIWWEQAYWEHEADLGSIREYSMPKAAFRLRNEADEDAYWVGVVCVMKYVGHFSTRWWRKHSQPIHWIISSLIAKQKEKEDADKD